jgi:hypothetical protein
MKKIICLFAILSIMLVSSSCQLNGDSNIEVLEVNPLHRDAFNHSNEISETVKTRIEDSKVGNKRTVTFNSKQYYLVYAQTITYIIGGVTVDQYSILNSNKEGSILLLPDGSIFAILKCPIVKLDIDEKADSETVRKEVEKALGKCIDFSAFEHVKVTESLPDKTNGFGLYFFVWYNKIGDIMTDQTLQLCVKQNGEVGGLWMKYNADMTFDSVPNDICIDNYIGDIEKSFETFMVKNWLITRFIHMR